MGGISEKLDDWLHSLGIKDFDALMPDEKTEYLKWLNLAEKSQVTLEDIKKHIKAMREAVEYALATHKLGKDKDKFLKARLKNYLLMENLFDRPQRAKDMLEQYQQYTKIHQ